MGSISLADSMERERKTPSCSYVSVPWPTALAAARVGVGGGWALFNHRIGPGTHMQWRPRTHELQRPSAYLGEYWINILTFRRR